MKDGREAAVDPITLAAFLAMTVLVNGSSCADRTQANEIRINDTSGGAVTVVLDLAGGDFAPGFTDETGTSDEIEFTTSGFTTGDRMAIHGSAGPDAVSAFFTPLTTVPVPMPPQIYINLNAGEPSPDYEFSSNDYTKFAWAIDFAGRGGNDTLTMPTWPIASVSQGGGGNDRLITGPFNDRLYGHFVNGDGPGKDVLDAGAGDNKVVGGRDNDRLFSQGGDDTMLGGPGHDRLTSTDGNDLLNGGPDNDSLVAGAGNDTLLGAGGDDDLEASDGNDTASGGGGADYAEGNSGHDAVTGGAGPDDLTGGRGNDALKGGSGNDICLGGADSNTFSACETRR